MAQFEVSSSVKSFHSSSSPYVSGDESNSVLAELYETINREDLVSNGTVKRSKKVERKATKSANLSALTRERKKKFIRGLEKSRNELKFENEQHKKCIQYLQFHLKDLVSEVMKSRQALRSREEMFKFVRSDRVTDLSGLEKQLAQLPNDDDNKFYKELDLFMNNRGESSGGEYAAVDESSVNNCNKS